MTARLRFALAVVGATLWVPAPAQVETVQFANARHEALYGDLVGELRCLVCANQSLSDSNSGLAADLRRKVRDMVRAGRGREEIVDYMTARYGEYVLYRPRFSPANFFLWLAPFAAALGGLAWVIFLAAGKSRRRPADYSAEQLRKVKTLLKGEDQ